MPLTRANFERQAFGATLSAPPGRQFAYSNAGYGLLAAVVEHVAGSSFTDFIRQTIFDPAIIGWRH